MDSEDNFTSGEEDNNDINSEDDFILDKCHEKACVLNQFAKDIDKINEKGTYYILDFNIVNATLVTNINLEFTKEYQNLYNVTNTIKIKMDFQSSYLKGTFKPIITIIDGGSLTFQIINTINYLIHDFYIVYSDIKQNFIEAILDRIKDRVYRPGARCVNCDQNLPIIGLKPTTCDKQLCYFQYTELGLQSNLLEDIRRDTITFDLLVNLTYATTTSNRADKIMNPFPERFNDYPDKYNYIKKLILAVGSLQELCDTQFKSLTDFRDYLNILANQGDIYYLLQWIYYSNRTHLTYQKEKIILDNINKKLPPYKHCFQILSNTPEKEAQFQELSLKHENHFGFHGSSLENWHSILRLSLKNYSNTDKMTCGAAFGPGIYLADDYNISLSYTKSGVITENSILPKQISLMLLCQIVNDGSSDYTKPSHYVIKEEKLVSMKYLFIL